MGEAVDAIVEDWLLVSRQRSDGVPLTFIPYSSIGAVMVQPDSPIATLADLKGKKLGVAGGPLDKGWLMLQAYARQKYGIDLATEVEPVYGAPPLLTEKLKSGELDAVLNTGISAPGSRRGLPAAPRHQRGAGGAGRSGLACRSSATSSRRAGATATPTWSRLRARLAGGQADHADQRRRVAAADAADPGRGRGRAGGLHAPLPRGHRGALGRRAAGRGRQALSRCWPGSAASSWSARATSWRPAPSGRG